MNHISISGTKEGATPIQKNGLLRLLTFLQKTSNDQIALHHGDCIGIDHEAHIIAHELGYDSIVMHPPIRQKYRAYADQQHGGETVTILPPYQYLTRNRHIVDASNILIVCPKESQEVLRSGTWAACRYARKQNKIIIIIDPITGKLSIDPESNC